MAARKTALASIGGLALVIAASFFGFDLTSNSSDSNKQAATHTAQPSATAQGSRATSTARSTSASNTPKQNASKQGTSGLPTCPVATLPDQARDVIGDIKAGGPFQYPDNDGVHFGNFENKLPRNNYREYTVETPGLGHRGAKRIVTGGGSDRNPDTWFFTSDHYENFCEIPDAE
ncbi:ribonuclease domain-containing protein [Corynebacterium epidermidicanis]|uniref:Guanyl-specific ribonuclease Sa n=1 Tax=Corynebacterium epidermidicanis TaxID=1050174 RepID=A0A0G3GR99_9CORY|nr:ribonuclease domain-containing protein [Corynebacterium epidermidicanis]AKK03619.1 guanyl-specific ribonuclease Sa [Corynebacterium epidermidicanis]